MEWGPLSKFDKTLIGFYITGVLVIWLTGVYFLFFKPIYEEYKDPYPTKEQWNAVFENKCTYSYIRENVIRKNIALKQAHVYMAFAVCDKTILGNYYVGKN